MPLRPSHLRGRVAQDDALTTNAANRVMAIARLTLLFILIGFDSNVAVLHTM
jgi:hypothetical protein